MQLSKNVIIGLGLPQRMHKWGWGIKTTENKNMRLRYKNQRKGLRFIYISNLLEHLGNFNGLVLCKSSTRTKREEKGNITDGYVLGCVGQWRGFWRVLEVKSGAWIIWAQKLEKERNKALQSTRGDLVLISSSHDYLVLFL